MEKDEALRMLKERLIQARTYFLFVFSKLMHTDAGKTKQNKPSCKSLFLQEHIEELSSLTWSQLCHGGAEGEGGAAASLRKQLKAKDTELRQVQRRMDEWKEQTAARLACKFEEELTAELER